MNDLKFEKSRIINFTDAVFAIAMTLLVLEISIPSSQAITNNGTLKILSDLIPNFIGFLVSFFVIALYWIAHLRIMKFVNDFDMMLLWLSIFLLLFIVLLPFSTSFYVGGFNLKGPFAFYCFNLSAIGLFNYLIVRYIIQKEKEQTGLTAIDGRWQKARALNALIIWVLAGLLAFILPFVARFFFLLIFVIQWLINRHFRKRVLAKESGD